MLFLFLGFTIAFREFMGTIPSLWDTVLRFKRDHPEVADHLPAQKDTLFNFITDDNGNTYNCCHFWTNFEVCTQQVPHTPGFRPITDIEIHLLSLFT